MRVVLLLLLVGCSRTDPEKCDKAIRNYYQLQFWEKYDSEIAAAPAEQRESLRTQKQAQLQRELEHGISLDVSKCTSANFSNKVDCMIAAKTAKQARECMDD